MGVEGGTQQGDDKSTPVTVRWHGRFHPTLTQVKCDLVDSPMATLRYLRGYGWNKALLLSIASHVIGFNQLKCLTLV